MIIVVTTTRRLIPIALAAAAVVTGCSSGDTADTVTAPPNGGAATTVATSDAPQPATTSASSIAPATTAPPSTTEPGPTDPLLVTTALGPVRGTTAAVDDVRAFLNIPYAEAPVDELRFAPPQARRPWDDQLDATQPGPSCPQAGGGTVAQFTVTPEPDDDCLSLNVWAPEGATDLPVMVWFAGGGLSSGSAHQPLYIGDQLAARGAVVVGVNYRVGALGFLDGNWGLLDQIEGLGWVQDNIAAFGGDPSSVTLFGQSAGAFSICGHLATPTPGVFHRAIIQSGYSCDALLELDEAGEATSAFLAEADCPDIECLRGLPTDQLVEVSFAPTLINDKAVLDRTVLDLAVSDELPSWPVMLGFTADEAGLSLFGTQELTDEGLAEQLAEFVDDPAAILAVYPADMFESNLERLGAISTDLVFACGMVELAAAIDSSFLYEFSYVSANTPFGLGAVHGAELPYLFGHPEGLTLLDATLSPEDVAVADFMQRAWVDFATTGDPGWAPYGAGNGAVMDIGTEPNEVDTTRSGRCDAVNDLS